jgi:hypothetical protein
MERERETDEIALNPALFRDRTDPEIRSTLVHEMVHRWQAHFGKPGRGRYHNKQWDDHMDSISLVPSGTGLPGGKRVGRQVLVAGQPVGVPLGHCDRRSGPEAPIAPEGSGLGTSEKPQLPVAGLVPQELQNRPRVGGGQPLLFDHSFPPSSPTRVKAMPPRPLGARENPTQIRVVNAHPKLGLRSIDNH